MSFIFCIVDMQGVEAKKFLPKDWGSLSRIICSAKDQFSACGVQAIHFAFIPKRLIHEPVIGSLQTVHQLLEIKTGFSLRNNPGLAFAIPVADGDNVLLKDRYSAAAPQLYDYFAARKISTLFMAGVWESEPGDPTACLTSSAIDFAQKYRTILLEEGTNIMTDSQRPDGRSLKTRAEQLKQHNVETMPFETP